MIMHNIKIMNFKNFEDAERRLREIGVDKEVISLLADKMFFYVLKIDGVNPGEANIIKQTALSKGTDAAVHRDVITGKKKKSDMLLAGTKSELLKIADALKGQPFGLSEISSYIRNFFKVDNNGWNIKDRVFDMSSPLIMGILNVTPDSFYDGGKYTNVSQAVEKAYEMKEDGADIIDIGGESSRPGAEPITITTELKRVIPVIEKLGGLNIPISIDTYKSKVAKEAIDAGAGIVNDISGLRFDKKLSETVAEEKVGYILMHMLGTPRNMQKNPSYQDVIGEISNFFTERLAFAQDCGINYENIVIDPGIGFGKRLEDNIEIFRNIKTFITFKRPILLGASRKSFIGGITGLDKEKRLEGSLAAVSAGVYGGASIFRVHDVKETKRFLTVLEKID